MGSPRRRVRAARRPDRAQRWGIEAKLHDVHVRFDGGLPRRSRERRGVGPAHAHRPFVALERLDVPTVRQLRDERLRVGGALRDHAQVRAVRPGPDERVGDGRLPGDGAGAQKEQIVRELARVSHRARRDDDGAAVPPAPSQRLGRAARRSGVDRHEGLLDQQHAHARRGHRFGQRHGARLGAREGPDLTVEQIFDAERGEASGAVSGRFAADRRGHRQHLPRPHRPGKGRLEGHERDLPSHRGVRR